MFAALASGLASYSVATGQSGPTVLEVRVDASSDDAEEREGGNVSLGSSDLELVFDGDDQTVGVRFTGIGVPQGATIVDAYVQFQADETDSGQTDLTITGEDVNNAATFGSQSNNITSRPMTSASVPWSSVPSWLSAGEAGPDQRTPDIGSVVQEIVDRAGWSSGNSLALIISGSGKRVAESYNGSSSAAPLLHIEYTTGQPANQPPVVDAGPDQTITLPGIAILDGTVTDDDLPNPPGVVTTLWTKTSGPGSIAFADPEAVDTTASFSTDGVYVLRLTATDSELSTFDELTVTVNPAGGTYFVGAGDISICSNDNDEETAQLLDGIAGTVFTLGDNAYEDGTTQQFDDCYDPTWGRHKARTQPTPGNHDYHTSGAAGYYAYFGAAAGDPSKGYYSYDIGGWHVIALNTECGEIGGCDSGDPQGQWLIADLAANPTACTVAYGHRPRWSSGNHGGSSEMADFWQILYDANADVLISGHDHIYERFALQDPNGVADPGRGIRQFVVGTGGKAITAIGPLEPNSETNGDDFGVLKVTLNATSYDWEFVPIAGASYTDSGSEPCHNSGGPGVLDVRVDGSSDDAEERAGGNMSLGSSDLELVFDAGGNQTVGMRFDGITVAQGATITNAYVQFQTDETSSGQADLTIVGEDVNDAATFSSQSNNVSSRTTTSASVSWPSVPSWLSVGESGPDQRTPNIASVIQEIVDRAGWSSGNALALIITGSGERSAEAYNGSSSGAPLLHLEYSTGAPSTVEVRVNAGSDDAEEATGGNVELGSSDLEMVFDGSDQTVGMRFNGIGIPQGATITNAYIQFKVDETPSGQADLTITGQDVNDAATFSSQSNNITSRATTSASVSWPSVPPWSTVGEAGPDQQTPNIASVIQEIVDRGGWSSGNSLVLIVTGSGERVAESFNGDPGGAPLVHIEYTTG